MRALIKGSLLTLFTAFCLILGFLPEIVMYFTWHLIQPDSTIAKILLMGLFWVAGAGLCVFFGFIAISIWLSVLTKVIK